MPTGQAAQPRVAVVGCGYWGRNLVRNFAELGALVGVSDANPERQDQFARSYGVPGLSVDSVVASAKIDAVVIATPAAQHATLALAALATGKHVFVEKPLALDIAEAEQIRSRAQAAGRVVMVGHLLQYHPAFVALKELCARGELGRLQYLYSNRLNLGKIRREENVFWSFAPHDISMILTLAGELPESVTAVGHPYLHKSIADVTTTHLAFPSGVNAHVFVSWVHPFKEQKLVAVGDAGMAVFDDGQPWDRKLVIYPHKVSWRNGIPEPAKADAVFIRVAEAEPLKVECQHFLECIAEGRSPRTDAAEGLAVLRVLDAAERGMVTARLQAPEPQPGARPYFAHPTAIIDPGVEIGAGTKIWHFSHVLGGSRIGCDCVIGQNVSIGPDVSVGSRCKIQNNVSLYKGVALGDGVFCGPSCVFTNVNTPRAEIDRKDEFQSTRVGCGASIGANATIVCGHELGDYCFVGAGAVVTRDVPAFALVVGNPARQIGWVSHAGARLGSDLVCPRTHRRYTIGDGRLVELADERKVA